MIETGFSDLLLAEPTIAALVDERVTWLNLDGEAVSGTAMVLHIVGAMVDHTLTGDGYQRLRVQIDCWAPDYGSAATAREAVRAFLSALPCTTLSDGTVLQFCEYIHPLDFFDSNAEAFRNGSEWYLHYTFPAAADTQEN